MTRASLVFALALAACGGGTRVIAPSEPEDEAPPRHAVALRFEEATPSPDGTPRTRVSLVRIAPSGQPHVSELGVERGACYHRDEPDALIAGVCWWPGAGARYVLRRQGDAIVVLRADAAENGASYGQLAPLTHVDVPAEAELDHLGAR